MWLQNIHHSMWNTLRRRRKYACLVLMFVFVPFSSYWRDKCVFLLLWTNFHVPAQSFVLNSKAVHRCVHCLPYIHIEQKTRFHEFTSWSHFNFLWYTPILMVVEQQHFPLQRKDKYLISFIYVRMNVYVCRRAQATCTWVWRNAITIIFNFNALKFISNWVHGKRIHQFVLNTHTFDCNISNHSHTHPRGVFIENSFVIHLLFEIWTRVFL